MKKVIIGIIVVILIAIIAVVVISNNKNGNIEMINSINNNSNLPVKYMSEYDDTDSKLQNYEKLNNYMSNDFKDRDISFSYYGYPNDVSKYYLGRISLLTNKYDILGVTIGDNMKQSISKLEKYGFKSEKSDNYLSVTLKYKEFTIKLESDMVDYDNNDDVTISNIELEVESKYLGNTLY